MTSTTATKSTLNLDAATLPRDWEEYLLERIFSETFWSACDAFVEENFDELSDAEREKIHTLIQERTQVIIKSPSFEWDAN